MRAFNNMEPTALAALKQRFQQGDIDRMVKSGSREIALDIALMDRNRMQGTPAWRLARHCLDICRGIEARKYGEAAD